MNTMENTAHLIRDCIQHSTTTDELKTLSKFTRLFVFEKYRSVQEEEAQKMADCLIAEINTKHLTLKPALCSSHSEAPKN
ncbi:MAG: hypothetical protein J0L83_14510 [Chitinophagales bacterium]|nr:hypothetical protein [Chitinophagales bacterium]